MAEVVLGPLLRYVDETSAAVWVETDRPSEVEVLGAKARTFCVHDHHYALVEISGLAPGTSTPYAMRINDEIAWPTPDSGLPPPRIRTLGADDPVRLVFGSCRMSVPHDQRHNRIFGVDVLRAFAHRLATIDESGWPTALLMLGDQVYADDTSEAMQDFIKTRRDVTEPPGTEVAGFDEYAEVYRLAWSEPWSRWLLSTLPSSMIFDDHDIRDDWNTSLAWREAIAAQPWWKARVTGGLAAYWIYQHLGNMSPAERANDPLLAAIRCADGDAGQIVDEFAWSASQKPDQYRWSYSRDFGRTRLVMLDSRCGRVLEPTRRTILGDADWQWAQARIRAGADSDHVLIGTSLPYILPRGLHHVESWNEAVAAGAWGRRAASVGERIRQGIDLEHWAAFNDSFHSMSKLLVDVASAPGNSPATITFLSGDVHYSYAASVSLRGAPAQHSRIHQLVCSPIRNPLHPVMRYLNGIASFGVARLAGTLLARAAKVPRPELDWRLRGRPRFDNTLATFQLHRRSADVTWETADVDGDGFPRIREVTHIDL